jgi:hypothetical protein
VTEGAGNTVLVIVEEAFVARGKGVLVLPRLSLANPPRQPFRVLVRRPDKEERATTAVLELSHVTGSLPPYAMLRLPELAPEDVPPGSEVVILAE